MGSTSTADGQPVLGVEDLVARVVVPISQAAPVLMIVVDGMSAAVAAELAEGMQRRGWSEMVTAGARLPVLAALPTVTRYSLISLFCGRLTDGGQAEEKAAFSAALGGAALFHKDDLRAPAGEELAPAVRAAVQGPNRVVGVVLNTVDDALAKADPGGTDWTVESIQHLPALLDLAASVGRCIILTCDHGHVVERESQQLTFPGSQARYRPADAPAGDGEVLLAGPQVLATGGRIVAAVSSEHPVRQQGRRLPRRVLGGRGDDSAAGVQPGHRRAGRGWRPAVGSAGPGLVVGRCRTGACGWRRCPGRYARCPGRSPCSPNRSWPGCRWQTARCSSSARPPTRPEAKRPRSTSPAPAAPTPPGRTPAAGSVPQFEDFDPRRDYQLTVRRADLSVDEWAAVSVDDVALDLDG